MDLKTKVFSQQPLLWVVILSHISNKSNSTFVYFSVAVMTQTVQTNGVQPLSKTWELSLYELQRTPQVMIFTITLV